jgi:hypothetical protein
VAGPLDCLGKQQRLGGRLAPGGAHVGHVEQPVVDPRDALGVDPAVAHARLDLLVPEHVPVDAVDPFRVGDVIRGASPGHGEELVRLGRQEGVDLDAGVAIPAAAARTVAEQHAVAVALELRHGLPYHLVVQVAHISAGRQCLGWERRWPLTLSVTLAQ